MKPFSMIWIHDLSQVDLSQFMSANNIRFVDRAEPDFEPVSPNMAQNIALSILLGLLGGAAMAFFIRVLGQLHQNDRRFGTDAWDAATWCCPRYRP